MSLRNEQCNKVCRILDDVLANRPTERDTLITAVRKAFGALEPERKKGKWIPLQLSMPNPPYQCSCCFLNAPMVETGCLVNRHLEALLTDYCPHCGADMTEGNE